MCIFEIKKCEGNLCKIGGVIPPNGVYIQSIENNFYTYDKWISLDTKPTPNGVAVVANECQFVIALIESPYLKEWGNNTNEVSGITTTTELYIAKLDYKGEYNTDKILKQGYSSSGQAIGFCREYTFPNGNKGYCPGLGEWYVASVQKNEVDDCMSVVNGVSLTESSEWWSSTQYSYKYSWLFGWNDSIGRYGSKGGYEESGFAGVRPFTTLF